LVTDLSIETDAAIGDLRTQVFDRLNTGGVKLNAQKSLGFPRKKAAPSNRREPPS
jgi:hypothetical protein